MNGSWDLAKVQKPLNRKKIRNQSNQKMISKAKVRYSVDNLLNLQQGWMMHQMKEVMTRKLIGCSKLSIEDQNKLRKRRQRR
jgi:hypothetical protein